MSLSTARTDEARRTATGRTPLRRCLVTGETMAKARLLRFVVGPDAIVVPDLDGRLPGRGLWLACRREIVERACARDMFSRAARQKISSMVGPAGETMAEWIDAQLVRRALDALALARKAGEFHAGHGQVADALARLARDAAGTGPALLLRARDAGTDGRRVARKFAAAVPGIETVTAFGADEIGRIAGREHTVHALVRPGTSARSVLRAMRRLAAYRGEAPLDTLDPDGEPTDEHVTE